MKKNPTKALDDLWDSSTFNEINRFKSKCGNFLCD